MNENAATVLPRLAVEYFEAGAALFESDRKPEELHAFRLKTKHFRYTMELFEEHYGPKFGVLMERLKPVQDALGEINDATTTLAWLAEGDSADVMRFLLARIAEKTARFEKSWKTVFDKPGERERWVAVLGRVAASGSGDETGSRGPR